MIPRTLEPEVMDTATEAVDYDSMDHSTVNRVFVDDLLRFTGGDSDAKDVLDLGTGTALIPLQLLATDNRFNSVIACDLSIEMLKLAVAHVENQQLIPKILPAFCDCKRLPVSDISCDMVMSNSIIHHIPEPVTVFHEIRRVIKPGGHIFIRDLMRPKTSDQVEQFVVQDAGSDNAHQQQMFRQSLHAALSVDEVRRLLADCGLQPDCVTATSDRHWTIACVAGAF